MMEYCELHKDLSDEEGDNCPLCECMDSKARILGTLATLREELAREKLGYQSLADHAEVHERELRELLWRAEEVVRHYASWYNMRSTPKQLAIMIDKAQALLPDLEAIRAKEKP